MDIRALNLLLQIGSVIMEMTKSLKQFAKKNLNNNNYCFRDAGVVYHFLV